MHHQSGPPCCLGQPHYHRSPCYCPRANRRTYCRNGVREYPVLLVAEARLEWLCLEEDEYRPQLPDADGLLHSRVFPCLRLPVAPLLAGDTVKVLAALAGQESPETSVKRED